MARKQRLGESIFEFIDSVRKLAQHIEVNDKDDKNLWILSVLVNGLRDRKQAERIQLLDNVNLDKAISTLIATETVQRQDDQVGRQEESCGDSVDQVRRRPGGRVTYRDHEGLRGEMSSFRGRNQRDNRSHRGRGDREYGESCATCGYDYHDYDYCPAENQRCNYCDRRGHFAVVCSEKRQNNMRRVNPVESSESSVRGDSYTADSDDEAIGFLGEVSVNTVGDDPKWIVRAHISDCYGSQRAMNFKLDTGAGVSCLPSHYFRENCKYLVEPKLKLISANKKSIKTRGVVTLDLEYDGRKISEDFYVVENLKTPLLGLPAIEKMKIITRVNKSVDRTNKRENIALSYHTRDLKAKRQMKSWIPGGKIFRERMRYDKIGLHLEKPRRYKFPLHYPPPMFAPSQSLYGRGNP